MLYSTFLDMIDIFLLLGLICMGVAYYTPPSYRHLLAGTGHFIYASYWLIWSALYIIIKHNPSNAVFTLMGVAIFCYLGYHEIENHRKNEYLIAMNWAARGTALTAFLYLLIERIDHITGWIVYVTAWYTVKIMNLIGFQPYGKVVSLGKIAYNNDPISVAINGSGINIILACTGIQAMILFLVFNIFLVAETRRKFYGFLITVPVIFMANQLRNLAIIALVAHNVSFGLNLNAFDLAHNWLGKGFSFLVLIGIVIYAFKILPEALLNLFDLIDLRKRTGARIVDGRIKLATKQERKRPSDKNCRE